MKSRGEQLDEHAELLGTERDPGESDTELRERLRTILTSDDEPTDMEDADKPMSEAETGEFTARTPTDITEMVTSVFERANGGSLDEERYRNAGDITVYEESAAMTVNVLVPLPYFHHSDVEPEELEDAISPRFPPSVQVQVGMAPPPTEDDSE